MKSSPGTTDALLVEAVDRLDDEEIDDLVNDRSDLAYFRPGAIRLRLAKEVNLQAQYQLEQLTNRLVAANIIPPLPSPEPDHQTEDDIKEWIAVQVQEETGVTVLEDAP